MIENKKIKKIKFYKHLVINEENTKLIDDYTILDFSKSRNIIKKISV